MPMLSDITLAFVLAHVLADYHLQNQSLARRKATGTRAMLWHSGIVAALALLAAMLLIWRGGDWALLAIAAAMALLHLVVDIIKRAASGALRKREQNRSSTAHAALYVADQALHLLLILALVEGVYLRCLGFPAVATGHRHILQGALLLALITKPANVSFKMLFAKYQLAPAHAAPQTEPSAGALIGTLERIITALFIYLGQYGAIGLIYTAKSIARFKQIEDNPRFAEYYLIGTLYSILFVVLAYHIVKAL